MIRRKQWTSQSQYGMLEAFMINFILMIFCYLEAMLTDRLRWKSTSKKNRPGINVAATSWFWFRFPDENLKVFQYHYNFLFPKICNIALQIHFLINKICYVCVNGKRSLKWVDIWKFAACCLNREKGFLILCSSLIRSSSLFSGSKFGKVVV